MFNKIDNNKIEFNNFLSIPSKTIDFTLFLNLSKEKKVVKCLNFFVLSQEAKLKSV